MDTIKQDKIKYIRYHAALRGVNGVDIMIIRPLHVGRRSSILSMDTTFRRYYE